MGAFDWTTDPPALVVDPWRQREPSLLSDSPRWPDPRLPWRMAPENIHTAPEQEDA